MGGLMDNFAGDARIHADTNIGPVELVVGNFCLGSNGVFVAGSVGRHDRVGTRIRSGTSKNICESV